MNKKPCKFCKIFFAKGKRKPNQFKRMQFCSHECFKKWRVNNGCKSTRTHGLSESKIYLAWRNMKRRCDNPSAYSYKYYGARGITYDPKWKKFENFYEDMKENYKDGMTLERIDSNGNYCKENCTWANHQQQARNRRSNAMVTHRGETKSMAEWAELTGIKYMTLRTRILKLGWSAEKALNTNVRNYGKKLI